VYRDVKEQLQLQQEGQASHCLPPPPDRVQQAQALVLLDQVRVGSLQSALARDARNQTPKGVQQEA
jgi:hypothetical protein